MHYTAGMILSIIFQLAHVVPKTEMLKPDNEGNMKHTWAVHQLYTTANFGPFSGMEVYNTGLYKPLRTFEIMFSFSLPISAI